MMFESQTFYSGDVKVKELKQGKLLVVEGSDGIGKSHLSNELACYLENVGIPVLSLSFPGRREGSLGKLVYSIHHCPMQFGITGMTALGLQALHIAAHIDEITAVILPALKSGKWIVLDRFWWSTWVYGINAGADTACLELLIEAEKNAWSNVRPSAVFMVEREHALREEHTQAAFQRLAALYAEIRVKEGSSQPTYIIDNNNTQTSAAQVLKIAAGLVATEERVSS